MHILIDIGNSTIVVAIADHEGNITNHWRFKTRKEETVSFFRYELKQGLRKYGVELTDVESVTISSVVPEVDDDVAQPSISSRPRSWAKTVLPMLSEPLPVMGLLP